jgi:hypothetical protein
MGGQKPVLYNPHFGQRLYQALVFRIDNRPCISQPQTLNNSFKRFGG